ncbi:hypothetical protein IP70_16695 [alpha proteobacterium AAP38]|nr:hypothetical protein IP70_16695 [alpha proteobacterium AAP38]
MLGVEDGRTAERRIAFLQSLPMVAWFSLGGEGLATIAQVLAAEAMAACEGHADLMSIRDRTRQLLMQTGPGHCAIGGDALFWREASPLFRARKWHSDLVAALAPLNVFDENRTIGELSRLGFSSPEAKKDMLARIRLNVLRQATIGIGGDAARAEALADQFMERVADGLAKSTPTAREFLVMKLVEQGVDEEEIRDDCVLADLSRLGVFRSQLREVAPYTGRSFEELKRVPMEMLPTRVVNHTLLAHGQPRERRPGSDLNDRYLGTFAAYCDVLYVDKRTAEDFRRAIRKEPRLAGLIGEIATAPDFDALLGKCEG